VASDLKNNLEALRLDPDDATPRRRLWIPVVVLLTIAGVGLYAWRASASFGAVEVDTVRAASRVQQAATGGQPVLTASGYLVARRHDELTLDQQRTVAVIVLFIVAVWVLAILARPMNAWRLALVLLMGGAFVGVLVIPPLRRYFDLPVPPDSMTLAAIGIGALAAGLLELGWRLAGWSRTLGDRPTTSPT